MRQLILDTETTGLDPKQHRVIELAAVEVIDRRLSGRSVHFYINPDRDIDLGATDVHGLSWEMLRDRPKFGEIADQFLEFAGGAQWIIHNAPFDIAFLDEELGRLGRPSSAAVAVEVLDTLALAREQFPGKRNTLDALCERFGVANAHRTLHGALLDAQLLAEVYLAMTRGQESLLIEFAAPRIEHGAASIAAALPPTLVLAPSPDELAAHRAYLIELDRDAKGACLWLALSPA